MSDPVVKDLSPIDEDILKGFEDPLETELEQIIPSYQVREPEVDEGEENVKKVNGVRDQANEVLNKIEEIKADIDERCSHLEVKTTEVAGSALAQAMWRVFREKTTTVTYDHYKKAIELREQLAREDQEGLRNR
jgi:predicted nuclease with TOPRIM domain